MHTHTNTHTQRHTQKHKHMLTHINTHIYKNTHTQTHTHKHTHTHTHTHKHTHIHTQTHKLTHKHISDEGPLPPSQTSHVFETSCEQQPAILNYDFKLTQTLLDHYWSRLLKEYVPELNKRLKWQKSNEELDEADIVGMLKDFTPRGIWLLGKIVKAHRGSDGIARSFDLQTATGMVPMACIPTIVKCAGGVCVCVCVNTHTHTHTNTKTHGQNEKFFALFCCVYIFISNACFCCR